MAVRVTRCYSYILNNAHQRLKQRIQPSMVLQTISTKSKTPVLLSSSSLFFTSARNSFNSTTTSIIHRYWMRSVRQRFQPRTRYSNEASGKGSSSSSSVRALYSTDRIKVILKEYGTVAVVFHTVISLCSLGSCYLVVSSGVDVEKVFKYFNFESSGTKKGASTFALAYVLHKVLLPLRATITVVSVPVIVRSLRARGWMKGVSKVTKPTN